MTGKRIRRPLNFMPPPASLLADEAPWNEILRSYIFEPLIKLTPNGILESSILDLSHSGPAGSSQTFFIFRLKSGVAHCDGSPVTPEQLARTFRRLHALRPHALGQARIHAHDDFVSVRLESSHGNYMAFLPHSHAVVLSENEDSWGIPLGVGGFRPREWSENRIVLEKVASGGSESPDEVEFRFVDDCHPEEEPLDWLNTLMANRLPQEFVEANYVMLPPRNLSFTFWLVRIPDERLRREVASRLFAQRSKDPLLLRLKRWHLATSIIPEGLTGSSQSFRPFPTSTAPFPTTAVCIPWQKGGPSHGPLGEKPQARFLQECLTGLPLEIRTAPWPDGFAALHEPETPWIVDVVNNVAAPPSPWLAWRASFEILSAFTPTGELPLWDLPPSYGEALERARCEGRRMSRDLHLCEATRILLESGYIVPICWREATEWVHRRIASQVLAEGSFPSRFVAAPKDVEEVEAWALGDSDFEQETLSRLLLVRDTDGLRTLLRSIVSARLRAEREANEVRAHAESLRKEAERDNAIASLTSMLAHDVRKPLSLVKYGLQMLRDCRSPEEVAEATGTLLQESDRAFRKVDGLIEDVMEARREAAPLCGRVCLETLLGNCVRETRQEFPRARIDIHWALEGPRFVDVDSQRVDRLFANIVLNAFQAMVHMKPEEEGAPEGLRGTLLLASRELLENGQRFAHITVGNDGPLIPQAVQAKLFDAYFSTGKRGGTGLGLAIAKKVVVAHGGRIWCDSPGSRTSVEFHMTLPAHPSSENG